MDGNYEILIAVDDIEFINLTVYYIIIITIRYSTHLRGVIYSSPSEVISNNCQKQTKKVLMLGCGFNPDCLL